MKNRKALDSSKAFLFLKWSILFSVLNINALTVTSDIKKPNHSLLLKTKKDVVTYTPNSSFHFGVKLSGPLFFLRYSFKIPSSNFGKSNVGNESYSDARLGVYIGQSLTELFYKRYKGFSSTESGGSPGCSSCLIRNELTSTESLFQYIYALDEKIKLRSIVSGARDNVSFNWSPILNVFGNRLSIKDGEGLVQGKFLSEHPGFTGLQELDLRQVGLGGGIGMTYPVFEYLYFGVLSTISFGYQKNKLVYAQTHKTFSEYGVNYNLRLSFGTHNKVWNFGVRSFIVSNFFDIGEETSMTAVNYEARLYASYTF